MKCSRRRVSSTHAANFSRGYVATSQVASVYERLWVCIIKPATHAYHRKETRDCDSETTSQCDHGRIATAKCGPRARKRAASKATWLKQALNQSIKKLLSKAKQMVELNFDVAQFRPTHGRTELQRCTVPSYPLKGAALREGYGTATGTIKQQPEQ